MVSPAKARGQKVNSVSLSPETAQRPSASVIEAADAMREVAGNVAQNNCIHCADAHDACHGKSDRKTGWADRETRAAPEAFLG